MRDHAYIDSFEKTETELNGEMETAQEFLDGKCPDDVEYDLEDRLRDVNVADVAYRVDEIPPFGIMISSALQNLLLSLAAALTTAYVISDIICADHDHPIRAKLFCTTLLMTGICTTAQPLIGVRLPIFQVVCSTFLVPLFAMKNSEAWKCTPVGDVVSEINGTTLNMTSNGDEAMYRKLREMSGCLMLSSLVEVLIGATGLVGFLLRYIGPLTIAPVVSLIGLSLYKIPMEYARTHWGLSAICIVVCVVLMLYLDRLTVPCLVGCRRKYGKVVQRVPVFQMFPVLISILITWLACYIMTTTGALSDDPSTLEYRARTDIRNSIIHDTPWFYLAYPGQFGSPLFNTTIFVGFLTAVLSSILESIGDYYATALIARAPPPPMHAVNRGILWEGLGSVLSGAMGAGHATTSSTSHVAVLTISKVTSRSCMVVSGVLCIVLSLVGKVGAVLSTMPDPAIGGSMFITFAVLAAVGIFSLKSVDLTSSRNLGVFGISLYTGIVIPEWMDRYPEALASGNETVDGVVKGLLGIPMFLGGVVAIILDNSVRGSRKERGFIEPSTNTATFLTTEKAAYDLPFVTALVKRAPWLGKLPFIQPYQSDSH